MKVSGATSSCKEDNSQSAALQEAHALRTQQTADRPTNNAQASALPVALAASTQMLSPSDQPSAQNDLSTQLYAQLPVVEANRVQASAVLPPALQALSPQACDQTSSLQQSLPATDFNPQPGSDDHAYGLQNQGVPATPAAISATLESVSGAFEEPTKAPADSTTCGLQQPGTTTKDSAQQMHGDVDNSDEAMMLEEPAPDAAGDIDDNQQSPDQQTAAQNLTDPAAAKGQHQSELSAEDTAAAVDHLLSAAAMVDTEPGSSSAQKAALIRTEPEPDTEMDLRSAADIFEQTVQDCKTVISAASSILLNKEAEGAGGGRTSRIAANERATMWHNELQGLLKRCKMPQLYIGVLGDTGVHLCYHDACSKPWTTCLGYMSMPSLMIALAGTNTACICHHLL